MRIPLIRVFGELQGQRIGRGRCAGRRPADGEGVRAVAVFGGRAAIGIVDKAYLHVVDAGSVVAGNLLPVDLDREFCIAFPGVLRDLQYDRIVRRCGAAAQAAVAGPGWVGGLGAIGCRTERDRGCLGLI